MARSTALVWLRNDLRLTDNPALTAGVEAAETVIALYVHERTEGIRAPGGAARWWLHQSLEILGKGLADSGITLVVRSGDSHHTVLATAHEFDAKAVFWNRRYGPGERVVDATIKDALKSDGISAESFAANVLIEPWEIATGQGKPYSVFTPFWKTLKTQAIAPPLPAPEPSEPVAPKWAAKFAPHWSIGEAAARAALEQFLDGKVIDYPHGRDIPARDATSLLSPHLRFGEISPRQVWHVAMARAHAEPRLHEKIDKFLSELAWRDFNYHQLYHRADITTQPMQPKYGALAWRHAPDELAAWRKGLTGWPIVDAGMRELWETGYMHNRVRMLVASLLSKNLLLDWRLGEEWFWDCLLDADVASNPGNWQWVAGCGLDASPYFRIFNPVIQGERFDRAGDYVRRWVPELKRLPENWIHKPSEAPPAVLRAAGVELGRDYPKPVVDLKLSRQRALEAAADL
jgi:deoxyribodipyrimidine photo-lyase